MDIAGLSMAMASNNLQTKVGTAVLSKAMDTNEALGQGLVQMIDSAAFKNTSGSGLDFVIFVPSEIASKSSVSCVCARMNFVFLLEEPIAR